MENLDSTLFPGVSSVVLVHDGFRNEHALAALEILTEVKSLIAFKGAECNAGMYIDTLLLLCASQTWKTLQVSHSSGGALAELESFFMASNLPSSISVKAVTYGASRV